MVGFWLCFLVVFVVGFVDLNGLVWCSGWFFGCCLFFCWLYLVFVFWVLLVGGFVWVLVGVFVFGVDGVGGFCCD